MKKVLMIEDDSAVIEVYQQALGGVYEFEFAKTGELGFTKAVNDMPNLIILDIMLPGGINGFEVLRKLKQLSKTSKIPVIVLSNLDDQNKTAMEEGAVAYFVKANVDLNTVVSQIGKYLKD